MLPSIKKVASVYSHPIIESPKRIIKKSEIPKKETAPVSIEEEKAITHNENIKNLAKYMIIIAERAKFYSKFNYLRKWHIYSVKKMIFQINKSIEVKDHSLIQIDFV